MNINTSTRILILSILFLVFSSRAIGEINTPEKLNYLSFRGAFPISLLEFESIYSLSVHLKYNNFRLELERGQILRYNSYSQSEPDFEAKAGGGRTRLILKYYIYNFPKTDKANFHFYTSIMPSFKNVKYKMVWWSYDSIDINNKHHYAESSIPVTYTTKSLSLNLLFGNEFYISNLNIDYYGGVGIKFFDINIPSSTPIYYEPISRQTIDGTYFNVLVGAKIGYAYRLKKKRKN